MWKKLDSSLRSTAQIFTHNRAEPPRSLPGCAPRSTGLFFCFFSIRVHLKVKTSLRASESVFSFMRSCATNTRTSEAMRSDAKVKRKNDAICVRQANKKLDANAHPARPFSSEARRKKFTASAVAFMGLRGESPYKITEYPKTSEASQRVLCVALLITTNKKNER